MTDTKPTAAFAKDDVDRCTALTESGRRCLLITHKDDVKHRYVNRKNTDQRSLKEILGPNFTLTATEVKPGEVLKKTIGRKALPRDDEQKRVDKDAKVNYDKNHKAGHTTKTEFADRIHNEYIVPPRAVSKVLEYLNHASQNGGTVKGTQFNYRKGTHPSGNIRIHWAFVDKVK